MLWVKVVLLLRGARLVNLIELRPGERVDHVDLFLLDTADPLTVVHNGVMLGTFSRSHHFLVGFFYFQFYFSTTLILII